MSRIKLNLTDVCLGTFGFSAQQFKNQNAGNWTTTYAVSVPTM